MHLQITPNWRITLDKPYQRRIENDQLVLWTTGRTILMVVFRYQDARQREMMLAELKSKAAATGLETLESQQDAMVRFGYIQPEEISPGHVRLALHAFCAAETTCLQSAFYFDIPADLPWAIQTWETIQYLNNKSPNPTTGAN